MSLIEDAMLFIQVIQAGSFTQTALQTSSSKSQISRRIANLEQRLNSQLLIRLPRRLKLTQAGELFYQACLKIQQDFEQATTALQNTQTQTSGHIAITAPITLGSMIIGPLLAKFMRLYPGITLELDLSDQAKSIAEDKYDLAIRAASSLTDSNLKAKRLMTYGYTLSASPDYITKYGLPNNPNNLTQHRMISCVTNAANKAQDHWEFDYQGKLISVKINSIAKVTHMAVQKKMALEGIGIIRTPTYWVEHEIENGKLITLLNDHVTQQSHIYALYKNLAHQPKKLTVLIEFLAQHLPEVFNSIEPELNSNSK